MLKLFYDNLWIKLKSLNWNLYGRLMVDFATMKAMFESIFWISILGRFNVAKV